MSQTTNKYGIKSKSVIRALTWDDYDLTNIPSNVYSCTEVIDAPKIKTLQVRHADEIVTDVADNFWLLDGSAVHYSVEMSNKKGTESLSEERLYLKISEGEVTAHTLNKGQKIVEAEWYDVHSLFVAVKYDNYEYDEATLEDYKRSQVWEVVFGLKKSRMEQLNIGALAMRLIDFPVKLLRSVLFLKSWDKKDYKRDQEKSSQYGTEPKYPPIPYAEFEQEPMGIDAAKRFLIARAELHNVARMCDDDEIPECSEEDRWYRGESFAVMKKGNQAASKVFKVDNGFTADDAQRLANQYIQEQETKNPKLKGAFSIEHRPGINQRCIEYCKVQQFCHFGRTLVTE